MDRRRPFAVLILVYVLHRGLTCEAPTDVSEVFEKVTHNVGIRTCSKQDKKWKDGSSVLVSECIGGNWTELNGGCSAYKNILEDPSCDPAVRPAAPELSVVLWEADAATVYGCGGGALWGSGSLALVVQCVEAAWTTIDDFCTVTQKFANELDTVAHNHIFWYPENQRLNPGKLQKVINPRTNAISYIISPSFFYTVPCPEGFVSVQGGTSCLYFSSDAPSLGFAGAALSCGRKNASLAIIRSVADLSTARVDTFYYTAHNFRGDPSHMPSVPSVADGISCYADCQVTSEKECVAVAGDGTYRVQSCTDWNTHFPTVPTVTRSILAIVTRSTPAGSSVTTSLQDCAKEGSDLAYPENMHTLQFLADLVRDYAGESSSETLRGYLGVNRLLGWNDDGIFAPDADILESLGVSGFVYFASVMVGPSQNASFNVSAVGHAIPEGSYAVCKLHGILDCWRDPHPATANMSRTWDQSNELNAWANYTCQEGFHVSANANRVTQHLPCRGQLGAWGLAPWDCAPDGCFDDPPLSPSQVTMTPSLDYRSEDGVILYTCPADIATLDNVTVQNVTCTRRFPKFVFLPETVQECLVCIAEPTVGNATTDWDETAVWYIGDNVTATCLDKYHLHGDVVSQTITCTATGWQKVEGCVLIPASQSLS
ncbi:uncharacterized protein LOC119582332 [Penaeus monodon]|uniref:uncharacterized protein LOC119582332 n=1 Tax=Penaeus monodon TaxID=6687 RepID=UPI0018A74E27|nr:uncharacterized protein LOC119582332 [Penaeus monodon]